HTEGLAESWANIYLQCAIAIHAKRTGDTATLEKLIYPNIDAGLEGVRWIENCVRSADSGATWVDYE
ncbi:gfo/Idh/MocA family oxidoreductase, partial [Brenneria sp. L3-3C-1]|nr:gfo/Idh/MocA family oxidoreductase [Brenneria sp. L3-3C-1]MEE3645157.1 gfo/Idh/MocA family oxidoreductase [Brenneria sp. L3_3C_1]